MNDAKAPGGGTAGNSTITNQDEAPMIAAITATVPVVYADPAYQENDAFVSPAFREHPGSRG